MKKFLAIFLALVLTMALLAGCAAKQATEAGQPAKTAETVKIVLLLPGEVNEEVRAKAAKAMDEAYAEAERTRKALHGELAAHDKAMTEREARADKAVKDARATVAKAYGIVKDVLDSFDEA